MKKDILQKAKGVRDFGPKEKIMRNRITEKMRLIFESYGYVPIETPIIERYELLASKFGQGEQSDSMRETFKLKDQGGRDLVLRNEFTVPLARFVGSNPTLRMPFKRYQMGQIFRDGPIKLGRYREFWQCDIDIVGNALMTADAEIISIAQKLFKELSLDINVYLNNRQLLDAIMDKIAIPANKRTATIIAIDKLDKIERAGVLAELQENKISNDLGNQLLDVLDVGGTNEEKLNQLREFIGDCPGLEQIKQTLDYLPENSNVIFSPSLARGLAYYTGNVFEIFLKDKNILSSSLAGGGRYDKMIGGFLESKEDIPAIGLGIGLETILDALMQAGQVPEQAITQIYVIPMGENNLRPAILISEQIRQMGYNVETELMNRKVKRALEYVNAQNIPFVVILGDDEIKENKITIKNMQSGQQQTMATEQIPTFVTK